MSIDKIKSKIVPILKKYGVERASLVGSFARGKTTKKSDVDILIKVGDNLDLLDFAGLKLELEQSLGRKVDLGEYHMVKPIIKESVLKRQIAIL